MEKRLRKELPGGKFENVSPERSKIMGAIRGKGARSTEVLFRMALARQHIKGWKVHPRSMIGNPDFFFPESQVVVFVDGCFWHGCPKCGHIPKTNEAFWKAKILRNRQRDQQTNRNLKTNSYHVVRFWEHEIKEELGQCINKLKRLLKRRRPPMIDRSPDIQS